MSVTEVKQAIGSWTLQLKPETPQQILDALTFFGHIALLPGQVDPAQYGDNLLSAARYVGVFRFRDADNKFVLKGVGMSAWLGDEDDKGDVFETAVVLNSQTFANSIRALLPPGGSITEGTLYSIAGTYTGKHQWVTPRSAITYVTDLFGGEWRVNNTGTLDAGLISDLYVTTPKSLILRKGFGADLLRKAIPGEMSMSTDVVDVTTRVVLLAEGEGTSIATAAANAPATGYKDIHGNSLKMTRLISESSTEAGNAAARAAIQLQQYLSPQKSVELSTAEYDIKGTFVVGDYIDVYDPPSGFYNPNREIYWQGEHINPISLRCVEMTWPIPFGWTVAFRDVNGNWIDLTPYYIGEEGDTTIVVGALPRGLTATTGEPIGVRPNLPDPSAPAPDSTIPGVPEFTGFSSGSYETDDHTLSAIYMQWNQPLNTNGSTITDGDHYEIRYRPNAVIGTPIPWDYLSGGYDIDGSDPFNTSYTNGWGPDWSVRSDALANFFTSSSSHTAVIDHPTLNVVRSIRYGTSTWSDVEILTGRRINYFPAGASTVMGVDFRYIDSSNYYWARIEPNTDGTVTLKVSKQHSGVYSELYSQKISGMTHTSGVDYFTRVRAIGAAISVKVWQTSLDLEPTRDTATIYDMNPLTSAGQISVRDWIVGGATNPAGSDTITTLWEVRSLVPDTVSTWSWDDLGSWDAIVSEPVQATPNWTTAFAGWDQNAFTLTGLGAGVQYEIQIRAVDAANPPNMGAWSPSEFVNTSGDAIAPSAPAAPEVAASMIAVQIVHKLGKSSGGTFNLEQDLHHFDVHASSSPNFYPDATTKVGELIANGSMIRGGVPAVGSFKVNEPDTTWIRVVAVDRTGNKSAPSDAVQSSVVLIDNAHISDLSVSKLTAGTITAQTVLAAEMEVGAGGNIKLTEGSLDVYDPNGLLRVEVGSQPDGSYDLAAVQPETGARVNLAQLAFGVQGKKMGATMALPANNTNPFLVSDLTMNVEIGNSGRVMVHQSFTCDIPQGVWLNLYVEVRDASNVLKAVTIGLISADTKVITDANWSGNVVTSNGTTDLIVGLTAGVYTFKTYLSQTIAHNTFESHVSQAQVIVVPF